ncbi:MAG: hypothetical protein AB1706_10220 [Pseudomonadota bacterium]
MSKKDEYLFQAQKLYTIEGHTLEDIAQKLPVTVRTLYTWSKDYNWQTKKEQYIKDKTNFSEEIYSFFMRVQRSIEEDIQQGIEPSKQRVSLLKTLADSIDKLKKYETAMREEQAASTTTKSNITELSKDAVQKINEVLGL